MAEPIRFYFDEHVWAYDYAFRQALDRGVALHPDATDGKAIVGQASSLPNAGETPAPQRARTMCGRLAWSLGGKEGHEVLRSQDECRVAPGDRPKTTRIKL
ncbi:MAG: hypothetical protein ACLQNE_39370 [Thermoguttaceae bacterium]